MEHLVGGRRGGHHDLTDLTTGVQRLGHQGGALHDVGGLVMAESTVADQPAHPLDARVPP